MSVNGIEIKEGQKWKNRTGEIVTIEENPGSSRYAWRAVLSSGEYSTVTNDGHYRIGEDWNHADLVQLVADSQEENTESIEIVMFTEEDIRAACKKLECTTRSIDKLLDALKAIKNPEYKEYLRLKDKFGE